MGDYQLQWRAPDRGKVLSMLHDQYDFSEARVDGALKRMSSGKEARAPAEGAQRSLDMF
jgi:hypothetical protein